MDNDPCTYGRPPRSSGSIYLNCLMVRELKAAAYLAFQLGQTEIAAFLEKDADELIAAIRTHCWDEWTGSYYSVDLNVGHHRNSASRDDGLPLHAGLPVAFSPAIWNVSERCMNTTSPSPANPC